MGSCRGNAADSIGVGGSEESVRHPLPQSGMDESRRVGKGPSSTGDPARGRSRRLPAHATPAGRLQWQHGRSLCDAGSRCRHRRDRVCSPQRLGGAVPAPEAVRRRGHRKRSAGRERRSDPSRSAARRCIAGPVLVRQSIRPPGKSRVALSNDRTRNLERHERHDHPSRRWRGNKRNAHGHRPFSQGDESGRTADRRGAVGTVPRIGGVEAHGYRAGAGYL